MNRNKQDMNGGAQINKRSKQTATKAKTFTFSRTLRHYITLPSEEYTDANQGWSDIPYQHICSSMKPSDWQALNTMSRKWRVLECSFQIHHIVPIQITTDASHIYTYNNIHIAEIQWVQVRWARRPSATSGPEYVTFKKWPTVLGKVCSRSIMYKPHVSLDGDGIDCSKLGGICSKEIWYVTLVKRSGKM